MTERSHGEGRDGGGERCDGSSLTETTERESEREREVFQDGGVIFLLADERFSSPHTSSAGDSVTGLQLI